MSEAPTSGIASEADGTAAPASPVSAVGAPTGEAERELSPAARRALAEAAERRRLRESEAEAARPVEINGRKGPEPVRYGDWEKNGIVSDF